MSATTNSPDAKSGSHAWESVGAAVRSCSPRIETSHPSPSTRSTRTPSSTASGYPVAPIQKTRGPEGLSVTTTGRADRSRKSGCWHSITTAPFPPETWSRSGPSKPPERNHWRLSCLADPRRLHDDVCWRPGSGVRPRRGGCLATQLESVKPVARCAPFSRPIADGGSRSGYSGRLPASTSASCPSSRRRARLFRTCRGPSSRRPSRLTGPPIGTSSIVISVPRDSGSSVSVT